MKKGDLIIIPTDTVYGLAARLYDQKALDKIYKVKGRDHAKHISLLISKYSHLEDLVVLTPVASHFMSTLWPGPLTLVMNTTKQFFEKTGEETIAVRMTDHKTAVKLLDEYGPMRVTSLNKSGEPPMKDINEIKMVFGPYVAEIHEQTFNQSDVSSTVIDIRNSEIKILREGNITKEDIDLEFEEFFNFFHQK